MFQTNAKKQIFYHFNDLIVMNIINKKKLIVSVEKDMKKVPSFL